MNYNITYREKDKGLQAIISYKDEFGKWKQKSKQGFDNSRSGKAKAKEWVKDTLSNLDSLTRLNRDYKDITFGEYIEMFLKDKDNNIEMNTVKAFKTMHNHFKDLDSIQLSKIKNIDIQRCVNNMGIGSNSIKNYVARLNRCMNAAVNEYEIISENPIKKIDIKKEKREEKTALLATELEDLLSKLKSKPRIYIASILAGKCGLRAGEILGLTWNDLNIKDCTITINKQWKMNKEGVYAFGTLKSTNSYRTIPVPNHVMQILTSLKPKIINIDNRIVTYKTPNSLSDSALKKYKSLGFDISIHELRHTYATMLVANGVDFKTAAELLGHDIKQTMEIYSHVTSDMRERAKQLINNIF